MKKEKIPHLRFSEFNNKWKIKKIKTLAEVVGGGTPATGNPDYWNGEINWFTPSEITQKFVSSSKRKITFKGLKKSSAKLLPKNSILFTSRATIGEIAFNKNPSATNQGFQNLVINENAHSEFIYYWIQANKRTFIKRAQGSTFSEISNNEVKKVRVILPEVDEQKKIANFLSSIDQKIQQLRRKKELLEEYKKGVMQKLFSREIRFKDEKGEDFPDWEYKELGDISDRITDKNEDEKYDFVLTNSAVQGVVSQTDYFDKSIANKSNLGGYYIVKTDDFVYNPRISSEAPVGPIKRNKLKTGVMSPLYSVFRINEKHLDFFEYFFETTLWHRYMHSVANFGARHDRMNITVGDFQKLPIPLPSEEEREKIIDFINSVSKKLKTVNKRLELAERFKKGLLQQMFV